MKIWFLSCDAMLHSVCCRRVSVCQIPVLYQMQNHANNATRYPRHSSFRCDLATHFFTYKTPTSTSKGEWKGRGGKTYFTCVHLWHHNFNLIVCVQKKNMLFVVKSSKLLPSEPFFLVLICTKLLVGAPDLTGEKHSAPPDPLAGFKGAYF